MFTLAYARQALFKYGSNVSYAVATASEKLLVDDIINQVCERFINSGKWRGTWTRGRFTVYDNQITLPAILETVLKVWPVFTSAEGVEEGCTSGCPYWIFGKWFDLSTDATGNPDSGCIPGVVDMGEGFATFRDPDFDFRVTAVPRLDEAGTATLLLRGSDTMGREVFSSTSTQGVSLTINSVTPVTTTQTFGAGKLRSWIKSAVSNGIVDLYAVPQDSFAEMGPAAVSSASNLVVSALVGVPSTAYDIGAVILIDGIRHTITDSTPEAPSSDLYVAEVTLQVSPNMSTGLSHSVVEYFTESSTSEVTMIASIYPSELVSGYRRYAVPSVADGSVIQTLCKRAYVPAVSDNDLIIPSNLGALKLGMMALQYEDKNDWDRSEQFWQRAFALLDQDRQEFDGDSTRMILEFAGDFGAGSIVNVM